MIEQIGAFAGLAAFLGLAVLALLSFAQGRDLRRLREWAGSAPERDAERKEATSTMAAQRAEELRQLEEARSQTAEQESVGDRDDRRRRREEGLPDLTRRERLRGRFSGEGSGSRLADPRALVALFLVFLLVAGGAAFLLLNGSDDGGTAKGKQAAAASKQPEDVEVTVLNGTAVPGLAATFGDKVERKGFTLGVVSNSTQSFADSVVMFDRGHAPEARRVAKQLQISQVRLITPEVESLAAGATVAVIVGEDNAETAG